MKTSQRQQIFRVLTILFLLTILSACQKSSDTSQTTIASQSAGSDNATESVKDPMPTSKPITDTMTLPEVQAFLSLDEYPSVDGSTANLPLMAAVMASSTGISYEEATLLCTASKTTEAYYQLLWESADLLLVYEAPESFYEESDFSTSDFDITPIGRDALVFIGNENNPVNDLSQDQLRDIYTGKIDTWSRLDGSDHPITAFQRPHNSGSQTMFLKLLMKGTQPMEAPGYLMPASMGDLIEVVSSYNNDGGAIGFSVFYYANYMYSQPGLKFFSVDGIHPTDATIADGSYPLLNEFYLITRRGIDPDSPTAKLAAWIQSDEGREVLRAAGYIPAF